MICAGVAAVGAGAGWTAVSRSAAPWLLGGAACAVGLALLIRRRVAVLALSVMIAAGLSGWLAGSRQTGTLETPIPEGTQRIAGRVLDDPRPYGDEERFPLRPTHLWNGVSWSEWDGPRLAVVASPELAHGITAGMRASVEGSVVTAPGRFRGAPLAGQVEASAVGVLGRAADPLFRAGNFLRARVARGLEPFAPDPAAALVSGFLIGDVRSLPGADSEALRRAGLTHFVAVSGSNVALFLAAWWLAAGPLGWGPRRRALVGLVGLALFVVVTRWEPSVVRAATMAALVLTGRLVGYPVDAWTALGTAATVLLLISGGLVVDVGFQLSAAATAGVLAGAGMFAGRRPRWSWTALGATLAAQAAVGPLLLVHFGSIPLLAPLSNLLAAPLVVASTATGGVGVVTGFVPVTALGVAAARLVLLIARAAAMWPQLGPVQAVMAAAVVVLAFRTRLRPAIAIAAAAGLALTLAPARGPPPVPTAVFLDVGQGDAALLLGPSGAAILIDGGPDPRILRQAFRRYGIRRIDLLVVSHHHQDHVAGLVEALHLVPVGRVWHPGHADGERELRPLLDEATERAVPVEVPSVGWTAVIGEFAIEVLGPLRRYDSPNDQSLVLRIRAADVTALFPGDVEAIAQRDLGPLPADLMKVPHQGAATSELAWLEASAGAIAVVSVGPNSFGHPSPAVLSVLEMAGAEVRRTDLEGDVVVPMNGGADIG